MLKSSYNIWNWSTYFCCIFILAFSNLDSTASSSKIT
uniref:Pco094838 n=1 Tax=Arundo donax TaxID=35708 RepID=A0A0A9DSY9_ARUDO